MSGPDTLEMVAGSVFSAAQVSTVVLGLTLAGLAASAGRVSPSGLTVPLKLCARPSQFTKVPAVSVNGALGSSTSAYSKQCLNGDMATTISAPCNAAMACCGLAASSSGSALSKT